MSIIAETEEDFKRIKETINNDLRKLQLFKVVSLNPDTYEMKILGDLVRSYAHYMLNCERSVNTKYSVNPSEEDERIKSFDEWLFTEI